MESYNSEVGAKEYINFINSKNGKIEQEVLYKAVRARLGEQECLLDAACGPGWLAGALTQDFSQVYGCDASTHLIDYAKANHPKAIFEFADITQSLPYGTNFFSSVIVNMALHDIQNQTAALKNLFSVIKPGGKLILTISNPYYSLPVGVWKRGIFGRLFFRKPKLKLNAYNLLKNQQRKFSWGALKPYFYPLSEQINNALSAGFALNYFQDVSVEKDSKKFDLNYQLYRFPYILLLEFKKPGQ